jgi:hypothetical protein
MEWSPASSGPTRIALTAIVVLGLVSGRSSAGILLASDSYAIGSDPTAGQYVARSSLNNQPASLANLGFENGGYTHGTGTANFQISSTGLASAADGSSATGTGSVFFQGATSTTIKSVARNLTGFNEGTSGTYWMSILVRADGTNTTTDGYVLSGFGGTVAPTLGSTSATATNPVNPSPGFLQGIYVGFSDDSKTANEADLVLRYRDTTGMTSADQILVNGANNATANRTFLVVAQVNINVNGTAVDQVNYWVNPADLNSVGDLNSTSLASGSLNTFSFQGAASGTGDFTRLNYAAYDWTAAVTNFDEARLGTTLDSIAPAGAAAVPEPASIALSALGGGLVALGTLGRRRRSGRREVSRRA